MHVCLLRPLRPEHFIIIVQSRAPFPFHSACPAPPISSRVACTRVRFLGSCYRHSQGNAEAFLIENFDVEGVPPFLAPEGGSGFAEARLTLP
jgi:hypothetical protein